MASGLVVKVGGSLLDLPDLGPRLRAWLATQDGPVLLVPGGGKAVDVVRDLYHCHNLGEEVAHWLALRALAVNGTLLQALLPSLAMVTDPMSQRKESAILDVEAFLRADEGRPGCLPHTWTATSDSVAARAAVVAGLQRLVLLKSVTIPAGLSWAEAAARNFVDPVFGSVLRQAPSLVAVSLNFRTGPAATPADAPCRR
jgi:aspartokinase-like uncharacterized kinase